jgi:hypothetical protein
VSRARAPAGPVRRRRGSDGGHRPDVGVTAGGAERRHRAAEGVRGVVCRRGSARERSP